jgi:hypothetical protein
MSFQSTKGYGGLDKARNPLKNRFQLHPCRVRASDSAQVAWLLYISGIERFVDRIFQRYRDFGKIAQKIACALMSRKYV